MRTRRFHPAQAPPAPHRPYAAALVLAVLCLLVWACGSPRRLGDLDEIVSSGELRVIVRPGYHAAAVHRTAELPEPELLRQLADRFEVRLVWVEAGRQDQVLRWLAEGRGDLAVSRFDPAAINRPGVVATAAVDWVEDLLIAGRHARASSALDLEGDRVALHRSEVNWLRSSYPEALQAAPVLKVPESVPVEQVLERVRLGRYALTVVDSAVFDSAPRSGGLRLVAALGPRRPVVWAVRSRSHRLRVAIDQFLFAEKVLARGTQDSACRDLKQVREAGVLRLVTRNSPTTCSVERGGLSGYEYDLAGELARRLGVRLELSIPPPRVDPLDWLEQGHGDLAALHEPAPPRDGRRFLVTSPSRVADLVAVVRKKDPMPGCLGDLAGQPVVAAEPVATLCRLLPLEPPMQAQAPYPGADALSALAELSRGSAAAAVIDEDTAVLELPGRPHLQQGPVVLASVDLVWMMNPSSPRLYDAVDGFLRWANASGFARQLTYNHFTSWQPYVRPDLPQIPEGALTPYDEVLQWAGRKHGIDWRLLASLMYEESRFDPGAVGPGGSSGLFQLMPRTWRELGVEDPQHPMEGVEAGTRYLRRMMDSFPDVNMDSQVAMALASFNVGPRHVADARRLAAAMNLDADRWANNVETAMLILDDAEVARTYPAGVCRCRRAVNYTRRILRRYRAYTEQFPPA